MAPRLHLPHRTTTGSASSEKGQASGARVYAVQRTGGVLVALFLLVFAVLGFASGQPFYSTRGQPVPGHVLHRPAVDRLGGRRARAPRRRHASPRTASTVMIVVGALFLLSAFVNSIVLGTCLNWLTFEISNVRFSVVVGVLLLPLGAYGRIGSRLPPDSPYVHPEADGDDYVDERPRTPEEAAAEEAMRDAEIAVVQHTATPDQYRRVEAMAPVHTRADRRSVWMQFDEAADAGTRHDGTPQGHRGLPHPRTGWGSRWHAAGRRHR